MNEPLRILHLEDSDIDAELVLTKLEQECGSCVVDRVITEDEFAARLAQGGYDVILADYTLPTFDGLAALTMTRKLYPDIPFIFVSGTIGEDRAVETFKSGATDYVLKSHLARLLPSIRRALKEAEDRIEHRRVEKALRASEDRYRTLFMNSMDAVMLTVPDGRILSANPAACRMFGRTAEEICEIGRSGLIDPDDSRLAGLLEERQRTGQVSGELTFVRKDGSRFPGEISSLLFRDAQGELRTSMVIRDISERQRAEQALRESEQKYRQIVDNALVGVYRSTADGKFLFVNDALARIFECETAGEMLASPVEIRYKRPEDRARFLELLREKKRIPYYEAEVPTKSGKQRTIAISAVLDGGVISGMVIDITEQKKLEAQLRHAQKMEAIGTLAGGVAHDFNNILNVIIGYGTLVLGSLEASGPVPEKMREVLAAADRAASLTKRLLAFSRKDVAELNLVRVSDVVLNLERMLARIIGEDIEFKTVIQDENAVIFADVSQLEQVLMNLAANARDAMPQGGSLTIRTGRRNLDDAFVAAHGFGVPGQYALIAVADTGPGIDAEIQKKIFEPFFTTKGVGEGTGLGLSIVYNIVKQHKGYVLVTSERGKGTVFDVLLPLSEAAAEQGQGAVPRFPRKGGTETILIAEDDDAARKLIRIVLESFGYRVIAAVDGEDAVKKFRESAETIPLVILDLIMPRMNGKEAGENIRVLRPGVKTLYMSGYAMDQSRNEALLAEGMPFMQKPLSPQKLLARVRELLDAP